MNSFGPFKPRSKVVFDQDSIKEALKHVMNLYNVTDFLGHPVRAVELKEILPPFVQTFEIRGRIHARVADIDGKEKALEILINRDLDEMGPIFHFIAGFLVARGKLESLCDAGEGI